MIGHFDESFKLLTGLEGSETPFPWQRALFGDFVQKRFHKSCDIPTGLGKTSIIAIWLLALAHHAQSGTMDGFPRRLVYVVNRRTVVDQATAEVERMREGLAKKQELQEVANALQSLGTRPTVAPLAISTLRGQFADNAEWRNDPARPAVVIGTVDMIGSRLLFTGYGCGYKTRPLHAGFLGQDALVVHDEAHLEPAFQKLISAIESEQARCPEFRMFRVIELTATLRGSGSSFGLTDADRNNSIVQRRMNARKRIDFHPIRDENKTAEGIAQLALGHMGSEQAIIVFVRKLEHVEKVTNELRKEKQLHRVLTGTLRGLERDALATQDPIFARFMPKPIVTPKTGTVFLICTSAGEVGINISADHMVCDLTPFDSMAQRFGRLNRFGDGDSRIDIVYEATPDEKMKDNHYELARWKTLKLLEELPRDDNNHRDASPAALSKLPVADRTAAFTPPPVILQASDILLDAWALTSIRQRLPGRPPVADWLHGIAEWVPPETYVAWREEVGCLTSEVLEKDKPEDLIEEYPLKPHELLRERTDRVFERLRELADKHVDSPVWLVGNDSTEVTTLGELVDKGQRDKGKGTLGNQILILPPAVGGLENGMLTKGAAAGETVRYDVADEWKDEKGNPLRRRIWDDDEPPEGMRLVRSIDSRPDADEDSEADDGTIRRRYWRWYVRPRSADDDGSRTSRQKQQLLPHLQSAKDFASAIVEKLGLRDPEASAVTFAALWHDLGKDRRIWQHSIRNRDYPQQVLAKSGGRMQPLDLNGYRHEFGSLIDLASVPEFSQLTPDIKDLIMHLIATHHGRARPHFPANEAFDPEHTDEDAARIAREVPRRFARLQRKYGRWGLAYLESLVRSADALASQENEASTPGTVAASGMPS